jgi:hypothetical protein
MLVHISAYSVVVAEKPHLSGRLRATHNISFGQPLQFGAIVLKTDDNEIFDLRPNFGFFGPSWSSWPFQIKLLGKFHARSNYDDGNSVPFTGVHSQNPSPAPPGPPGASPLPSKAAPTQEKSRIRIPRLALKEINRQAQRGKRACWRKP